MTYRPFHFLALRFLALALGLAGTAACTHGAANAPVPQAFNPSSCAGSFDIYFKPAQAELTAQAKAQIRAAQRAMSGCKIEQISVLGLPDATDDASTAQKISKARADAVLATLGGAGLPRDKMRALASGVETTRAGKTADPLMQRRVLVTVQASSDI
jgi:outer membrane protein OmpA-like peptidoglycan-associated protein